MFENNTFCTGAAFVPAKGGLEEDDGWIITFVHKEDTNISQVLIAPLCYFLMLSYYISWVDIIH